MALITVADLDARRVEYEDAAQAQAAVEDASAVVRAYVAPILDAVEAPDTPAAVVTVVVGMVRRVLTNPTGLSMETLGDYSYQAGTNAVATLLPTNRERKLLRLACTAYAKAQTPPLDIPSWGVGAVYQQADLPGAPWDDLGLV